MPSKRDFSQRDEFEQYDVLAAVWCDECNAANLGVEDPVEYEEDGVILLEGRCRQCGEEVVARIEQLVSDSNRD